MYKNTMNLIPLLLLGILVFPDAHASPIHVPVAVAATATAITASATTTASASAIECDACMFLANGMNQTVLHNPKVTALVTDNLEKMCALLPPSVQALCTTAAEQTAPVLLNHLGDFIATEGCIDLGVCHGGRD
jgi:hypothetical protein